MRHHVDHRKLGVTSAHRKAMLANLASSLILHDQIETTLPRAKELRRVAERLVSLGKLKTLAARRLAYAIVRNKNAVHKLFGDVTDRFAGRGGGYTRIMKLGYRHGDAAPMAVIEYLPSERKAAAEAERKEVPHPKKPLAKIEKEPKVEKKLAQADTTAVKKPKFSVWSKAKEAFWRTVPRKAPRGK